MALSINTKELRKIYYLTKIKLAGSSCTEKMGSFKLSYVRLFSHFFFVNLRKDLCQKTSLPTTVNLK